MGFARGEPPSWSVPGSQAGNWAGAQVVNHTEEGDAAMVWKAPTDQRFDFATTGRNRRMPVDVDGLKFVSFFTPMKD
ncbi:type I-E CRISPR-associated endoribonuclease Cas2 [Cereibacter azotoformans]|uniref:Uncharacterized protein n=1 Tax=Cereibacter sphaeroides (strain ATCC 17025 / ATH 2.4.3) TaxID=349102 RepID=A4WZ21_CERS5|nr:type I-E CRISPR-associated endoribonuclease Cas2 [Cereibacter azotoformans]ULB11282.1 type I-E CRISPR-associated endoribonuclease Cas2 [Cereibacter azotoformans]